jgi:hypothetical protein
MSSALDTGTGENRRRLTLEEAQRGDKPTPFTRYEWDAMHRASAMQTRAKHIHLVRVAMGVIK